MSKYVFNGLNCYRSGTDNMRRIIKCSQVPNPRDPVGGGEISG